MRVSPNHTIMRVSPNARILDFYYTRFFILDFFFWNFSTCFNGITISKIKRTIEKNFANNNISV